MRCEANIKGEANNRKMEVAMEIQYLGTAAAEGWPALFCDCEACQKARNEGGKNIRTRSQAVVDGKLLIDFCPDTYHHVLAHGLRLWEICHCIITHGHSDHFYPTDLMMKALPYAKSGKENPLCLYGSKRVEELYQRMVRDEDDSQNLSQCVKMQVIEPFVPFSVLDYQITPLLAKHDPKEQCLIYLISDSKGKNFLYGNDTALFPEETWSYLEKFSSQGFLLHGVSLDCTMGILGNGTTHMGYAGDVETKERLFTIGCADETTAFVLNHFSHNCGHGITHEAMEKMAAKDGFAVAYDGLCLTV